MKASRRIVRSVISSRNRTLAGQRGAVSATGLDPHTPAWFAALALINSRQAGVTATIVARARRLDVCSVCGDVPAPIYDLAAPPHLSIRLCRDCLDCQRGMFGLRVRERR